MPKITFLPDNITVEAEKGTSLLSAARSAKIFVETPCGGKGTCQKCRVKITASRGNGESVKDALLCQTAVPDEPITVEIPKSAYGKSSVREGQFENFNDPSEYLPESKESFLKKVNLQIAKPAPLDGLSDIDRFTKAFTKRTECKAVEMPLNVLAVLPEKLRNSNSTPSQQTGASIESSFFPEGEVQAFYFIENDVAKIVDVSKKHQKAYGIAVDIGTTTVALWLADMEDRKVIAVHNAYNGQIECGLDVISRINYAKKFLPELKTRILKTINELLIAACKDTGIEANQIVCVSAAGNTTMTHLLLGVIPEYIRLSPYTPAVFLPQCYTAVQVGIGVCENAPVLFAPAVGSYVGGDITAGLLCTALAAPPKYSGGLILFIDIGTNGEIVLGNNDFIFACACSAGPAFEGGGIKHGVRACSGAIERVLIDENGKPQIFTIGGADPIGICGSGVISAIAELFRKGIIDSAGKFSRKKGEYFLCDGISLNENDINNFIRAKGAIFSACQTMLDNAGMSFNDVEKFCVAGGFGRFLDLEDARTIGLLPRLPNEKFAFLGNTSVLGAYLTLVSEERRKKMYEIANKITYMDLSSEANYMDRYTGALFLPHTDKKLFE
ncbi:ferredoxin [Treponema sp. R8-4-B8]